MFSIELSTLSHRRGNTNEDSGDGDGGGSIDNLKKSQLLANAQVLCGGQILGSFDESDDHEEDAEFDLMKFKSSKFCSTIVSSPVFLCLSTSNSVATMVLEQSGRLAYRKTKSLSRCFM